MLFFHYFILFCYVFCNGCFVTCICSVPITWTVVVIVYNKLKLIHILLGTELSLRNNSKCNRMPILLWMTRILFSQKFYGPELFVIIMFVFLQLQVQFVDEDIKERCQTMFELKTPIVCTVNNSLSKGSVFCILWVL